jgi:hypothetical protein
VFIYAVPKKRRSKMRLLKMLGVAVALQLVAAQLDEAPEID